MGVQQGYVGLCPNSECRSESLPRPPPPVHAQGGQGQFLSVLYQHWMFDDDRLGEPKGCKHRGAATLRPSLLSPPPPRPTPTHSLQPPHVYASGLLTFASFLKRRMGWDLRVHGVGWGGVQKGAPLTEKEPEERIQHKCSNALLQLHKKKQRKRNPKGPVRHLAPTPCACHRMVCSNQSKLPRGSAH